MLSASLLLSKYAIGFVAVATTPAVAPQRAVSVSMQLPSDDELFASLRARVSVADSKTAMPPPLGPDEVGADCMGPTDVIEYCMKSLRAQAADGCSTDGCRAFLAFAVRMTDKAEDFVGQLQPGFFTGAHAFAPFYFMHSSTLTSLLPSLSLYLRADPQAFTDYMAAQPRYRTLAQLDEYKCMGTPDFSDMSRKAVQKLLVRKDGGNWEDLHINMAMVEVAPKGDVPDQAGNTKPGPGAKRRWLITSIYKQNGGS